MATIGLSWWLGLALAPTLGAQLLRVSPTAAMLTAAGVALAAGLSALALERDLPSAIRLTPTPGWAASAATTIDLREVSASAESGKSDAEVSRLSPDLLPKLLPT